MARFISSQNLFTSRISVFGITDLATFIIGTILIILLPGPNSLYVMSIATRYGVKVGYIGALGVFCGDCILILCTVLGAASLLHTFPWIFIALKIVGAIYLSYLGFRLLIAGFRTWTQKPHHIQGSEQIEKQSFHPFRTALTISLLNPKAILFYLSFFIQFVDPHYAYPALSFSILAIILQILSMAYLTVLIFSGIKVAGYFNARQRVSAVAVSSIGLLFCLFGIKLAFSTL